MKNPKTITIVSDDAKRAAAVERKKQRAIDLLQSNHDLLIWNEEKATLTGELLRTNNELVGQNKEKVTRVAELLAANKKLLFLNAEKTARAEELILANIELATQNDEKAKRATELVEAYRTLAKQHDEIVRQDLKIRQVNRELSSQYIRIDRYTAELIAANTKLAWQIEQNVLQMNALAEAKTAAEAANAIIYDNLKYTRNLIESSLDPLVVMTSDGIITDVNVATEVATGLPRKLLIGTAFSTYFTDSARAAEAHRIAFAEGRISDYELEMVNVDGAAITVLLNATLYKDEEGNSLGLFAAARDVTTTRKYERELLLYKNNLEIQVERRTIELVNSRQYFELVFNTIPDASMISRRSDGKVLAVNDCFVDFFGYPRAAVIGRTVLELGLYKQSSDYLRVTNMLLKRGFCVNEEIEFVRKNGTLFTGLLSIKGIVKDGVNCVSSYVRDISERKEREAETLYMADHDYLTGLYNRNYFERELARLDHPDNYPLSIMMGDINGLKLINDAFGHAAGDEILRQIAESIQKCCRPEDVLARVGGDEFAVIMPRLDDRDAHHLLLKIQAACERIHEPYLDRVAYSNVSLGYAVKTTVEEDVKTIVKLAEDYMYRRKLLEHKSSRNAIIASIKATMTERNMETEEHAERLIACSKKIGVAIGLSAAELDKLELLATLHDIGKVGVDDAILTKPGPLTDLEWIEMRKHPEIGYRIAISSPELVPIADMILSHHERWDGDGYPHHIKGEKIPLLSRIIAITDAFDAMTHDRPYRRAMEIRAAIDEITRCSNKQFDPTLVRIFLEMNRLE